ncbi:NUDIX hydrolase [Bifidobacterium sp. ESL0763]|uniref:NUDIX hydrolase n=1 Tax=Bifidobacterium sp. ESL0763 TaxID=2983227 RepID=UPI0023FA0A45|nr:NUDIX hydrolase [Bifidobacterium sp. ESL0763]MDF7664410.1 NUDIX hydrolase [Bifidobacterium sp. ESL0763]
MGARPSHIVEAAGGIPYRWTRPDGVPAEAYPVPLGMDAMRALASGGDADTAPEGNGATGQAERHGDRHGHHGRHHRKHGKRRHGSPAAQATFPGLEVCMVHRPKYDDWSWPKGKIEANESDRHAAVREIEEETGVPVALGPALGEVSYPLNAEGVDARRTRTRAVSVKHVTYWMARPIPDEDRRRRTSAIGPIMRAGTDEVDEVRWMSIPEARKRLSHAHDRDTLDLFVDRVRQGALGSRAVIIVRHSKAEVRKHFKGGDPERPITPKGASASFALTRELACYNPFRLFSSPWLRCMETIEPYAWHTRLAVTPVPELTEARFAADPDGAWNRVKAGIEALIADGERRDDDGDGSSHDNGDGHDGPQTPGAVALSPREIRDGRASVVCMHRPVIGGIFEHLRTMCVSKALARRLIAKSPYMPTGSAVALFVIGTPEGPRIIDIQRMAPLVY